MRMSEKVCGNIWCVGRNFAEHAREFGNAIVPQEPLIFLKPSTSVRHEPTGVQIPAAVEQLHPEVELVLKLQSDVRCALSPIQAWECLGDWAVGIDWTARDIQDRLKKLGHPWVRAKGFRAAASLGPWRSLKWSESAWKEFQLECWVDDQRRQSDGLQNTLFNGAEIVSELSQWTDLAAGDLIFTGTPAGVRSVVRGQRLEAKAFFRDQISSLQIVVL